MEPANVLEWNWGTSAMDLGLNLELSEIITINETEMNLEIGKDEGYGLEPGMEPGMELERILDGYAMKNTWT